MNFYVCVCNIIIKLSFVQFYKPGSSPPILCLLHIRPSQTPNGVKSDCGFKEDEIE
jgi:hypothetical protein